MGEVAFASSGVRYAIVRASSIYGSGPGRTNFAKFVVEKLRENVPIKALVDQYTTPTQATLLGRAIVEIVERELSGVFHVAGERMSRYDFAVKLAEALGLDASLISKARMEEMTWYAKRPRDPSLNSEKDEEHAKDRILLD
jgi:dTDP-4-dehydrorhamnose reductase